MENARNYVNFFNTHSQALFKNRDLSHNSSQEKIQQMAVTQRKFLLTQQKKWEVYRKKKKIVVRNVFLLC